jgi:molybdopterin molybdotransferase
MKPFGDLVPFEFARETIDNHILPVSEIDILPIDMALGRVLAEDIIARHFTPPFDRAGVDGYAVKASDTTGTARDNPGILRQVDEIFAGYGSNIRISSGECIKIATGASLPAGADAVVMIEDTSSSGDGINIFKTVSRWDNVGLKGEDIKKGTLVIGSGKMLDAGKIGVLASQGLRHVTVYRKPKIAIMPTGEEIVTTGKRLKPGQLYDINSHTLAAVARDNGAEPLLLPITGDSLEDIQTSLDKALEADMVVTSGGSSVGEKDLIINVLEMWGEVLFHGIQIKPGKPTTFAVVRGKPVIGMPGYPTSCLINAYLLLAPAIRIMARLPQKRNYFIEATLGVKVWGGSGRRRFQPVKIEDDIALPVLKESGAITGTAEADGYIVISEDQNFLEKGTRVRVTLF